MTIKQCKDCGFIYFNRTCPHCDFLGRLKNEKKEIQNIQVRSRIKKAIRRIYRMFWKIRTKTKAK